MVFGYDDAPEGHCEVLYDGVQVGVEEGVVGGRAGLGRGFEVGLKCISDCHIVEADSQIIQARLGCVCSAVHAVAHTDTPGLGDSTIA
jgi:hypothetical protein